MRDVLQIIVPTYNNADYLDPCVQSIISTGILKERARLFIVNNGQQPVQQRWGGIPGIEILKAEKNLGWEGGLALALKESDAPFVCFQNDDTFIPTACANIYKRMLMHFVDTSLAAVGPMTTVASGLQCVYLPMAPKTWTEVNWLIFFMAMVRREHLDAAGGIDTNLPGGDDIDLSIRFRKMGKRIIVDPAAFIIHHGFKTGNRVHGDGFSGSINGWNSPEMIERTQHSLIRKHGFRDFAYYYYTQLSDPHRQPNKDLETEVVRSYVEGDSILELGCGDKKTVENAIGVDRVKRGDDIPYISTKSAADVVADVQEPLPFDDFSQDVLIARHILEHCVDIVQTLQNWNKVLKNGGRLIIAVPDERVTSGIPLNSEHCHAFTGESLQNLAELCGFEEVESRQTGNGISFVSCFKKVQHISAKRELALA